MTTIFRSLSRLHFLRITPSHHLSIRNQSSIYPLSIRELFERKPLDQSVSLIGYLLNVRKLKTHFFLNLSDGSLVGNDQHLQVVASLRDHPQLPRLTQGCSVRIDGRLVRSTHPKQEFELLAEHIDVLHTCDTGNYPLSPRVESTLQTLRADEHMRSRSPLTQAILRLRSQMMFAFYSYFQTHQFVHIQTPCLTGNDCEGGGETFRVQPYVSRSTEKEKEYFNRQVYLTVSGQLHLETAANGLGRVYTLNPAFRADKNFSRFHLAEFWMLEIEVAGLTKLDQLLQIYSHLLRSIASQLRNECSDEFNTLAKHNIRSTFAEQFLAEETFPSISYQQAVEHLKSSSEFHEFRLHGDFTRAHENYLCQTIMNNRPFFIINYPRKMKPFYMLTNDHDDGQTVANFDFIFPSIGELSGGSLREYRYEQLKLCVDELDITRDLQWYLDLRRFGGMPTGGFGLGIERFLMALTGIDNVRDVILFPRYYQHCNG